MTGRAPGAAPAGSNPPAAPRVRLHRVPSLLAGSIQLLWRSAPREFVTTAGLQVLGGVAAGGMLLLVRNLLDAILRTGGTRELGPIIGWLILLGLLLLLTTFATQVQFEQQRLLSELVNREVTWRVLEVAGSADLATFERSEFHDEIERAWQNTGLKPMQTTQSLVGLLSSAGALVSLFLATLAVAPVLVPVLLAGAVPVVLLTARGSRALYEFTWTITPLDRRRAYLSRVLTSRQWIHEVISYRLAGWLRGRWRGLHDQRLAQMRVLVRRRLALGLLSSLCVAFLVIGPITLLTLLLATGHLQVSQAVAAVAGVVFLRPALQGLTGSATQLYECSLFLDDYHRFAQAGAERRGEPSGQPVDRAFSTLEVQGVGFTYPGADEPALRDISLEIRAGEVVALVGENGSGKTTLAKLLCGLYRPEVGRILWDGRNTAAMDPAALREHVAVVFQDFTRYFMTVRENVGVGRHERLDAGAPVEEAARRAGAAEFVGRLPLGYDTMLGTEFERGHELSIGQWQRIALARAVFRQAPFVILDEPTAALDARAEHELFEAMRGLFEGRTVLLISHRFSSVRSADRIFVLDRGRVVETGCHQDLVRLGGLYAELFTLQAAAYLPDGGR